MLFIDLDDFKVVNDTLGHAAGDRLLVAVADRVRTALRAEDIAARLGGDEFALLLEDEPGPRPSPSRSPTASSRPCAAPFQVDGHEIAIGASIGIAAARPGSEPRPTSCCATPTSRCTPPRPTGKNRYAVFEPTMHAALVERHALSAELSRSVGRGELARLLPADRRARRPARGTGVEALVRWRHPTRGLILGPTSSSRSPRRPARSSRSAAGSCSEACREAAAWRASPRDRQPLTLSVNLSAAQLQQADFVGRPRGDPRRDRARRPRQLVLELTETAMFHDTQTTIARLEALRALGVRIAIDDFGTGYSSLGYLRRFQVDILKIAREFIGSADGGWTTGRSPGAMVALGRTLDLRIIAEGIEEPGQLDQLASSAASSARATTSHVPGRRRSPRLPAAVMADCRRATPGRRQAALGAPAAGARAARAAPIPSTAAADRGDRRVHPLRAS